MQAMCRRMRLYHGTFCAQRQAEPIMPRYSVDHRGGAGSAGWRGCGGNVTRGWGRWVGSPPHFDCACLRALAFAPPVAVETRGLPGSAGQGVRQAGRV